MTSWYTRIALLLLLTALALPGCGKKQESSKINDPNSPGYIPPAKAREFVVNGQIDLAGLTAAVREYSKWKMKVPKELNELVVSKYLASVPALPPGQKYAINPNTLEVTLTGQ